MKLIKAVVIAAVIIWLGLFFYFRNPSLTIANGKSTGLVKPSDLRVHVEALAGIKPTRMFQNPESMFAAEKYIKNNFEKYGYKVRMQEVFSEENVYHNIIARYGDENSKDIIVIGAHYDVAGKNNPGADDNASGVAALLEVARLFQQNQPSMNFAVEFVSYSLEEPPFFGGQQMGSAYHAESLHDSKVDVKFMLSLEMIGYYSEELFSQDFPIPILYGFYPWRGNFIALVTAPTDRQLTRDLKSLISGNMETSLYSINAPSIVQGIDFSDHRSYWHFDWPAFMLTDTAFLRNHGYHEGGDVPARLNYEKMAEVSEGIYHAIVKYHP